PPLATAGREYGPERLGWLRAFCRTQQKVGESGSSAIHRALGSAECGFTCTGPAARQSETVTTNAQTRRSPGRQTRFPAPAGFRESSFSEASVVAGAGFEPATFGL